MVTFEEQMAKLARTQAFLQHTSQLSFPKQKLIEAIDQTAQLYKGRPYTPEHVRGILAVMDPTYAKYADYKYVDATTKATFVSSAIYPQKEPTPQDLINKDVPSLVPLSNISYTVPQPPPRVVSEPAISPGITVLQNANVPPNEDTYQQPSEQDVSLDYSTQNDTSSYDQNDFAVDQQSDIYDEVTTEESASF